MSAGMRKSYDAGRARVREINDDRTRFDFIEELACAAGRGEIILGEVESQFVGRIYTETNPAVPNLHPGDRNIVDSLRRKFAARLNQRDAGPK